LLVGFDCSHYAGVLRIQGTSGDLYGISSGRMMLASAPAATLSRNCAQAITQTELTHNTILMT
jgi:DNA-binding IclR family transcriptional regulator